MANTNHIKPPLPSVSLLRLSSRPPPPSQPPPPTSIPTFRMQNIISILLPFVPGLPFVTSSLVAAGYNFLWQNGKSDRKVLEDEIAFQDAEIARLGALIRKYKILVDTKDRNKYVTGLEEEAVFLDQEIHRLHELIESMHLEAATATSEHEGEVAGLNTKVAHLAAIVQDTGALRMLTDKEQLLEEAERDIESLSIDVQKQNWVIEQLRARCDTECADRVGAESMTWALKREVEGLKETIVQIRRASSQSAVLQTSICETRQEAVIKKLQEHIKTGARVNAEQEAKIRALEREAAAKEEEKEELVKLAEEAIVKCEDAHEACQESHRRGRATRKAFRQQVRELRAEWAKVWMWAMGEIEQLRSKETSLTSSEVDKMEYQIENDEEREEGLVDMSICSVLQTAVTLHRDISTKDSIKTPLSRMVLWVKNA
ncbi:hypothetical protein B0H10DRAFT_2218107 [Mycena sp. CBHHK59/15]|nr:hypothetical protein B0H10DRAFT_2218107 [Mycena sp. CBHHK59/15]